MKKIISMVEAEFNADIESVWNIVTNFEKSGWRSDVAETKITGVNSFTEYTSKGFPTYFTVTEKQTANLLKFELKNNNMRGTWTGEFFSTETGSKIKFTEELEVKNVVLRLFAKKYLKRQQGLYLNDLRKALK